MFGEGPVLLDGASGTYLIDKGMPAGAAPEQWAVENLDTIKTMHREYVEAGSKAIYTFTFGANRNRFADYGLEDKVSEYNTILAKAAIEAADGKALVGGDLSTSGLLLQPSFETPFETAVEIYFEQIKALADAGVDFIIIETMTDIQDARAAVIAAKEACSLPIFVTMTFEENGRTMTGTDPETAAITLGSLGVDALGTNCSTGPEDMAEVIGKLASASPVPVIAKPNAGLPGGGVMDIDEYVRLTAALVDAGATLVGGCCGSGPEHIGLIGEVIGTEGDHPVSFAATPPLEGNFAGNTLGNGSLLTSRGGRVLISAGSLTAIGERINPTGKKKLQEALRSGNLAYPVKLAREQIDAGANVLDINVGASDVDEKEMLYKTVLSVLGEVDIPLCIDSTDPIAIEKALRIYPGKALVNSVSAETGKGDILFPIIKKYGSMFIALPITDEGVPMTAEARIDAVRSILAMAESYGIPEEFAVVDPLALSIGSEADSGVVALKVIDWCKENGLNSTMGVSNISFGLPQRAAVNASMLTAAVSRGMTAAIVNVCNEEFRASLEATRALVFGEDIKKYTEIWTVSEAEAGLKGAILGGDSSEASRITEELLASKVDPQAIVDGEVLPALDRLGELFSEQKIFIPELMSGAKASKAVFAIVEPLMVTEVEAKATAVIATVKGDVHDIGKNLVALMLKNHGFNVIDMGKDVPNELILDVAEKEGAEIVCLSALLTTTMPRMAECANLIKERGLACALMVGGAVVTPEYAESIGAYYSADAADAVKVANGIISHSASAGCGCSVCRSKVSE
jgi:5-methyltetrahydrofolate--homocysteine methyltransferase